MQSEVYRSRERPRPWPIHLISVCVVMLLVALLSLLFDWSSRLALVVVASTVVAGIVWDIARCRSITIAPDALIVGARRFAWDEIEQMRVREVPIARAGIFIRLTESARRRHVLPAPHHRDFGFGLARAPTPELAAERFDLFLRAHRHRLVEWYALITTRQMLRLTQWVTTAQPSMIARRPSATERVAASLVIGQPDSLTIELRASAIDDLLDGAARAIGAVLPDAARWDPLFAGSVMVLVGPLELADDPRADACLAHVKAVVRSQIAGTPRAIAAVFAARE